MFVVFSLALVTLCIQLHPRYLSSSWSTYRMILYSCLAAYGVIPSIHWVYLSGGLQAEVVQVCWYFLLCPNNSFKDLLSRKILNSNSMKNACSIKYY